MLAIAPLEFRAKELNIKLVFNPSSANKRAIGSLVLHQAGMEMKAKLINNTLNIYIDTQYAEINR
jgi:hypothetical protein